jgi:UDP-N-acetylmuramyl pentapeptide phosphotransferase/UDP-N-acetylglucosamine-1-phosphate transferase
MISAFAPFWLATISSWLLGFACWKFLRALNVIDEPNVRSSHVTSTLRGGGIGILGVLCGGFFFVALGEWGWTGAAFVISVALIGGVSFFDDRSPLAWQVRFAVHFFAAGIMLGGLIADAGFSHSTLMLMGVVVLVGHANAFNFMDGINGIASAQAVVTGLGTALLSIRYGVEAGHPAVVLSVIVAGAAAGFVPHNFPRARMFMGDTGSVPLGFSLAALALWLGVGEGWPLFLSIAILHVNFVMDTALTMARRAWDGHRLHDAHREHFYQRLVRAGWSHTSVTGIESGLQVLVVLGAVAAVGQGVRAQVFAAGATLVLWLLFFGFCEREFRRNSRKPG